MVERESIPSTEPACPPLSPLTCSLPQPRYILHSGELGGKDSFSQGYQGPGPTLGCPSWKPAAYLGALVPNNSRSPRSFASIHSTPLCRAAQLMSLHQGVHVVRQGA